MIGHELEQAQSGEPMRRGSYELRERAMRSCRMLLASIFFCNSLTTVAVAAAPASTLEARVKAGCLFNFVRFTTWPAGALPPGKPIGFCSMGAADVERMLENSFRGREIESHPLAFRQISDASELSDCHLLFLSGPESRGMKALRKSPRATLMLIVGDDGTYSKFGTLLDFSIDGDRVAFNANGDAIALSHLRLSSKLLSLARFR